MLCTARTDRLECKLDGELAQIKNETLEMNVKLQLILDRLKQVNIMKWTRY